MLKEASEDLCADVPSRARDEIVLVEMEKVIKFGEGIGASSWLELVKV
jgi:hypothetical protein